MTIAVAIWSQVLDPGKEETIVPTDDIHVTNAALGEELADSNGRTIIKLTYTRSTEPEDLEDSDDEAKTEELTTILCSLTPGKIEQTTTNLILAKDETYTFNLAGKNKVYLTGNVVVQGGVDNPPFDDDSEFGSEEYSFDGGSSDLELEDEELESDASRFEEIVDNEDKKGIKRPRPNDGVDVDEVKQKGQKKQKNKDGKPVPTSTEANIKELEKEEGAKLEKKKDKKEKKKDKKEKEPGADNKQAEKKPVERELPGGLKVTDFKIGTGPMAKKGSSVAVRYVGKLLNGKQFDSNTKGKPFWLKLGRNEVIKGWEDGLLGMQVGGERLLVIPPSLGYGNKPQNDIPAGSTLRFEIKLLQIK